MKALILASALALLAFPAAAQTVNSGAASQSGSYSNVSINHGNGYRQAPSAIAPGLIAGGLSCSGSASIGGSGAGWGLSLGITKEDAACNAREDAKYIHGVTGDQLAAKERLCEQPKIRQAFARAGRPCYGDRRPTQVSQRIVRTGTASMRSHKKTSGYAVKPNRPFNARINADNR